MRAVIVEIKNSVAAALSEDGRVLKVKNKNYAIGQEIIFKNNNNYIKLAASIAASLVLFVTPAWAYLTPYSYVSLDINPSFEFLINRFDRVLEVRAVNDDGEKVVDKISITDLKNKEINEAVKNVIVELKEQGYIIEGKEGGVVLATSSKNQEKVDKLSTSLKNAVEEEITFTSDNKDKNKEKENKENKEDKETIKQIEKTEKTDKTDKTEEPTEIEANEEPVKSEEDKEDKEIKEAEKLAEKEEKEVVKADKKSEKEKGKFAVEVIEVSQDDVDEAKEHNVTPGKWNLVEKLRESSGDSFSDEDFQYWLERPVQEIMDTIKVNKNQDKKDSKETKIEDKKEEKSNEKEEKSNKN